MTIRNKNLLYWVLGAILIIGIGTFVFHKNKQTDQPSAANSTTEEQEVRAVVEKFGSRMKNIALLSEASAEDIRKQYEGIASEELITFWQQDITKAPGRWTSSPWPDRIEIQEMTKTEDGAYDVQGMVIEVTSAEETTGGVASQYQIAIRLRNRDGAWIITGYNSIVPVRQ